MSRAYVGMGWVQVICVEGVRVCQARHPTQNKVGVVDAMALAVRFGSGLGRHLMRVAVLLELDDRFRGNVYALEMVLGPQSFQGPNQLGLRDDVGVHLHRFVHRSGVCDGQSTDGGNVRQGVGGKRAMHVAEGGDLLKEPQVGQKVIEDAAREHQGPFHLAGH